MDINEIREAPRYLFTADYVFFNMRKTVDAFPKENFETGWHIQEFYEINIITRGNGYHFIEDQTVKAKRGDVFIIPPYVRHAFSGGEGFDVFHFLLSPVFFEKYHSAMSNMAGFLTLFKIEPIMRRHGGKFKHLHLTNEKLSEVMQTLHELYLRTSFEFAKNVAELVIAECLAIIVIANFCTVYSEMQNGPYDESELKDRFFADSLSAIHERFNESLTIDELASIAKLSRTAYLKKFKEIMGVTPKQFITRERINRAKNLLLATDKRISDIANETGFFDTAHFIKTFTKEVGVSPLEFRRQRDA